MNERKIDWNNEKVMRKTGLEYPKLIKNDIYLRDSIARAQTHQTRLSLQKEIKFFLNFDECSVLCVHIALIENLEIVNNEKHLYISFQNV